ncbi:molybdenum cofactor guanylyltransferase [Fusibacter paucivorans]|uniref:Probable molybdenum cofactor guanylyltransferase n=1 Tax=Fusibacter paucivorans TaxID=76009 RepID=A0ABS5PRE8_9FIRM|nr:molybdenum cofactor guanylyltransferase [Fusibacter paucivorans]
MKRFGTALILAGGQSRRMGYDKQKIVLNGQPLMYRNLEAISETFDQVLLSCNRPVLDYDKFDHLEIVADDIAGIGPMAGIMTGLRRATSEYVYILACDAVYDRRAVDVYILTIEQMIQTGVTPLMAVAEKSEEYYEPFNGFYHVDLLSDMIRLIGQCEYAMQPLIRACDPKCVLKRETIEALGLNKLYLNFNTRCELKAYKG